MGNLPVVLIVSRFPDMCEHLLEKMEAREVDASFVTIAVSDYEDPDSTFVEAIEKIAEADVVLTGAVFKLSESMRFRLPLDEVFNPGFRLGKIASQQGKPALILSSMVTTGRHVAGFDTLKKVNLGGSRLSEDNLDEVANWIKSNLPE